MTGTEQFTFTIDVPVRNEWRNVSLLVTSVQNCFNAIFANMDGSQAIAMVTGELLENAIKYGLWSAETHMFRLNVSGQDGIASVVVENPISGPEAALELLSTLEWIRKFPDAEHAYKARLLEIAQAPPNAPDSKLGLVRVAYEGNCKLNAEINGLIVRVTAEVQL